MTTKTSTPVTIETGLGRYQTIANVDAAARYMLDSWPEEPGPLHFRARQICLQVLNAERPPDDARVAFIEALNEAEIWVRC
jgi:hypothetical protein